MKVFLKENIKSLGSQGEIKNVSDGYARNYLFPNNLAVVATDSIISSYKQQKDKVKKEENELAIREKEALEKLNSAVVGIKAKANEEGTLFSAITADILAQEISKKVDLKINKDDIIIAKAIKKVGEHLVTVKINNKEANVKINIKNDK